MSEWEQPDIDERMRNCIASIDAMDDRLDEIFADRHKPFVVIFEEGGEHIYDARHADPAQVARSVESMLRVIRDEDSAGEILRRHRSVEETMEDYGHMTEE